MVGGDEEQLSEALPLLQTHVITYTYDGYAAGDWCRRMTWAMTPPTATTLNENAKSVWLNGTRTITLTLDAAGSGVAAPATTR